MLKYSKVSQYKIKKILNCFVEDLTSTETSELTKLNRNTIDRYYLIFRKILKQMIIDIIKESPQPAEYIGYVKQEYGPRLYTKVYKIKPTLFFPVFVKSKPTNAIVPFGDEDFRKLGRFLLIRFTKFRGFKLESYYLQVYETAMKFHYSKEELSKLIWKHLKKANQNGGGFNL